MHVNSSNTVKFAESETFVPEQTGLSCRETKDLQQHKIVSLN